MFFRILARLQQMFGGGAGVVFDHGDWPRIIVPRQDRTIVVPAQERTIVVPFQDRTIVDPMLGEEGP